MAEADAPAAAHASGATLLPPHLEDLALSRLEREYQQCLAASRPRAAVMEEVSDGEAAEAQGYAQLGGFSDEEQELEDDALGVGPGGDEIEDDEAASEGGGSLRTSAGECVVSTSVETADAAGAGEWVAEFDECRLEEERGAAVATEVLPVERVQEIKQLMANIQLAPPVPPWARVVSEASWMDKLIREAELRAGGTSASPARGQYHARGT
ncbi:hypothetical protein AB1Y20_010700 [Prymnesium parvum]|uniref:Uncharacterized protein n=1 Tax=Prymnesium parvum TaxID=97485 RepID=A0AB34IQF0_PRYPA